MSAGYGEAAAADGLCEVLVEVSIQTLEGGAVEAVGDHIGKADDVSPGNQLFGVLPNHLFLDGLPDGVGLGLPYAPGNKFTADSLR